MAKKKQPKTGIAEVDKRLKGQSRRQAVAESLGISRQRAEEELKRKDFASWYRQQKAKKTQVSRPSRPKMQKTEAEVTAKADTVKDVSNKVDTTALQKSISEIPGQATSASPMTATPRYEPNYQYSLQPTAMQPTKRKEKKSQGLLGSFKKGGKVKKTGPYKLHKGEYVVPVAKVHKMLKRSK